MDYLLIRGRLQSMGWRKGHDWAPSLSLFTFTHWRRKWQPTSVFLSGGLPYMGSHRVGHDWSDLAAAAAANFWLESISITTRGLSKSLISLHGSTSWFHKTGLWKSSQRLPVCCWLSVLWLHMTCVNTTSCAAQPSLLLRRQHCWKSSSGLWRKGAFTQGKGTWNWKPLTVRMVLLWLSLSFANG